MKILFVDNKEEEFERFMELPFAKANEGHIAYRSSPVGLPDVVENNKDLQLIILDILWEEDGPREAKELGVDAMQDLCTHAGDVPVVIYSVLSEQGAVERLIPKMMLAGAFDWISKDEPKFVRSARFERAYREGRDVLKRPAHRAILAKEQRLRSDVHVAVMFVDMSGFTALTDQIGPKNVVPILEEFYGIVGGAVTGRGGYVDKYIGDEVMTVFGASGLSTTVRSGGAEVDDVFVHVDSCIQTARRIQASSALFRTQTVEPVLRRLNMQIPDTQLREIGSFRVGIESGVVEIVKFDRQNEVELTFIGTPVNIAARVIGNARPGQIWIGKNAHDAAGRHLQIIETQEFEYKNLPGKFAAFLISV